MQNSSDRAGGSPRADGVCPSVERVRNERFTNRRAAGRMRQRGIACALAVAWIALPSAGWAENKAGEVGRESGLGAAAAISSLVYGPLKLVYATGGLVVGAFAWAFTAGDTQVAEKVFTRSLRGTYVVTPEILLGEERLEFIGRDLGDGATRTENVASASAATRPVPAPVEEPQYDELGW